MTISYIPHSIDEQNITLIHNNESHIIPRSSINYNLIKQALNDKSYDAIPQLLDTKAALETYSEGNVSCNSEGVTYKNEPVHNAAATKLLNLMADGYTDIQPWLKFIEKLMQNPSSNSRQQAYKFIEHRGMPLTADGNIIGYKGVRHDYKDKYSGKFSNHVGAELEMERYHVDDNINNGCSNGFHIGSHEYADSWGGNDGKLMLVEFSPKDIVSVPHDCEYAKLRVCKYKVVSECHDRKMLSENGVYGNNGNNMYGNNHEIVRAVEENIFGGVGQFRDVQSNKPGLTVNQILDAYEACDYDPPTFSYSDHYNDLVYYKN